MNLSVDLFDRKIRSSRREQRDFLRRPICAFPFLDPGTQRFTVDEEVEVLDGFLGTPEKQQPPLPGNPWNVSLFEGQDISHAAILPAPAGACSSVGFIRERIAERQSHWHRIWTT